MPESMQLEIAREIEETNQMIMRQMKEVEALKAHRYDLIINLEEIDWHDVIEVFIENGITPQEAKRAVLELVYPKRHTLNNTA